MEFLSKQQAQSRADEIRAFRLELARLRDDGVLRLSPEQDAALQAHHGSLLTGIEARFDIDRDARTRQLSLGMRIASFLGALAIAASVFYLFLQYWGRFEAPAQVTILVAAALGSFLGAMWLHRRDASGYFTKLAALVAFACFVLDTVMIGSIFNITPSDKVLLAWASLGLLLAYACDLRLLLVAAIACVIGYISARTGTWGGMYWLDFGRWPENFLPASVLIFLVPAFVDQRRFDGFAATWRICGMLCFLLPVLLLGNWGGGSRLPWSADAIEVFYQCIGFAACAGLVWLGLRRQWNDVVNTGVVFFVVFLYTKFYDWWWELMPKYLFFLVLGLASLLVLSVLKRLRGAGLLSGDRA